MLVIEIKQLAHTTFSGLGLSVEPHTIDAGPLLQTSTASPDKCCYEKIHNQPCRILAVRSQRAYHCNTRLVKAMNYNKNAICVTGLSVSPASRLLTDQTNLSFPNNFSIHKPVS